jgi:hypothetical protein
MGVFRLLRRTAATSAVTAGLAAAMMTTAPMAHASSSTYHGFWASSGCYGDAVVISGYHGSSHPYIQGEEKSYGDSCILYVQQNGTPYGGYYYATYYPQTQTDSTVLYDGPGYSDDVCVQDDIQGNGMCVTYQNGNYVRSFAI